MRAHYSGQKTHDSYHMNRNNFALINEGYDQLSERQRVKLDNILASARIAGGEISDRAISKIIDIMLGKTTADDRVREIVECYKKK